MTTEWIPWTGGECPIPDAGLNQYEIQLRKGPPLKCFYADEWDWDHKNDAFDIIAYRLIEEEQSIIDRLEGLVQAEFDHQNEKAPNYANISAREAYRTVLDLIKAGKEAKS